MKKNEKNIESEVIYVNSVEAKMKKKILLKEDKSNIGNLMLPYLMTGLFTIITLLIMLFSLKIYPFGDKAYLWADADQYFGIERFFGSITGKNDIFYSWGNVLGGNALSQLAYYSFSPFNIFYMLFTNHLMFAAHLVAYSKIITSSIAFCFCLTYLYKDKNHLMKALLSTCYAFMGYMVFYGWNTSWIDGVILLPIMVVGIFKIIKDKNIILYVISLAIALISNFYIGYMLCIGSFIFYIALILLTQENFWKSIKRSFAKYAFASLIGVGLSAFIFIPTYLSLPSNRKLSIIDMFKNMYINLRPSEILSGFFTGQINSLSTNSPLIYVGIFTLILDILFFVSKSITLKNKIVSLALIFIFIFSFEISFINKIWHGMSNNAWFNYRYSFLMSFVLLIIAYKAYTLIKEGLFSKQELILVGLIVIMMALYVVLFARGKINIKSFSLDIIFSCITIAVFMTKYHNSKIFSAFLSSCIVLSLICNGYLYLKCYDMCSRDAYEANKAIMLDAKKKINDESFYRMDKNFSFGRCDGNLFDYNGVTNYASTENLKNLEFIKKLGVKHSWMYAKYTTNLPIATESLFGIKYVLTNAINEKDYENIGSYEDISYYKNQYVLPILFPARSINNFNLDELNDFELINEIWKSINNVDSNVFNDNIITNNSVDGKNILDVTINKSGSVYLSIPYGSYSVIKVTGLSEEKEIQYNGESEIYYIGECDKGDSIELSFSVNDENYDLNNIVCYTESRDVIKQNSQLVNNQNISIQEISSSHLEMFYSGESKIIATTIPYDKGWKIYDNGKLVDTEENWNNFVVFQLDGSDVHNIKLVYRPIGFNIGTNITIFSLIMLAFYEIFNSNKVRDKVKRCFTQK